MLLLCSHSIHLVLIEARHGSERTGGVSSSNGVVLGDDELLLGGEAELLWAAVGRGGQAEQGGYKLHCLHYLIISDSTRAQALHCTAISVCCPTVVMVSVNPAGIYCKLSLTGPARLLYLGSTAGLAHIVGKVHSLGL